MKKSILISFICLVVSSQLSAQIEQGTIILGGMLGFSSYTSESTFTGGGTTTTTEGPKISTFDFTPWIGFLITEDLAPGIGVGFSTYSSKQTDYPTAGDEYTYKTSLITVTPGVRYYYMHGDMVHLWMHLGIPIGFGTVTNETVIGGTTTTTESKLSSFGVGINPGATIALSDMCGLDFSYGFLGFSSATTTTDGEDFNGDPTTDEHKSSGFGLDFAGTFNFGILFNF